MYNNHHIPLGKQLLRALWGIFLSLGFGGFWIGLCTGSVLLLILGSCTILIGLFLSIKSFVGCNSYTGLRNRHRAHRRYWSGQTLQKMQSDSRCFGSEIKYDLSKFFIICRIYFFLSKLGYLVKWNPLRYRWDLEENSSQQLTNLFELLALYILCFFNF